MSIHTISPARGLLVTALRRSRRVILLLIASAVFIGGGVSAAQAFTTSSVAGYPGVVPVPTVIANGNDLSITNQPRVISESARYANSSQYVCATHRLWAFNSATYVSPAAWKVIQQRKNCGWISPSATGFADAGAFFSGLTIYKAYSTDVWVTWQSSNGALLGRMLVNHDSQSDYTCYGHCRTLITADGVGSVMFDF
jgi:hypothetical protein